MKKYQILKNMNRPKKDIKNTIQSVELGVQKENSTFLFFLKN